MGRLHDQLKGGDRRSIGAADAVALKAQESRRAFDQLVEGLCHEDPLVRMRCADALEKASALRPQRLVGHEAALLAAAHSDQAEVRWHVAQMAPRVQWPPRQRARIVAWLTECLRQKSNILRTTALTALVEMAANDPELRAKSRTLLKQALASRSPSMRARARRLLRQFPTLGSGAPKHD